VGHVEQIRADPRHDVADDGPDQEALGGDAEGRRARRSWVVRN
jgi:hypothetical protein